MMRLPRRGGAACAAALVLAGLTTVAATPAQAAPTGRFMIFSDTAFSQQTLDLKYPTCDYFISVVPGQTAGSFDNAPLPKCQVVLQTVQGSLTLCTGRGIVPPAYRHAILYTIRPGTSTPCP